jgi:hypothetical protein
MARFPAPWFGAILAATIALTPVVSAQAEVSIGLSVGIAPPPLPVYDQPPCPAPGYIWTPGYWAYGPDGYYWVPGTWVPAPQPNFLWTPGYWGWSDGYYHWHGGYWGPHVGYYGGIAYGFGYTGVGFYGGYWRGGSYFYNRSVANVNVTFVHNTYQRPVVMNRTVSRVAFNGGAGGIVARPTPSELAAAHESHLAPSAVQVQHEHFASTNREFLASVNHGQPAHAAVARPGSFSHAPAAPHAGNGHAATAAHPGNRLPSTGAMHGGSGHAPGAMQPGHGAGSGAPRPHAAPAQRAAPRAQHAQPRQESRER